jgi:hypothetical protein
MKKPTVHVWYNLWHVRQQRWTNARQDQNDPIPLTLEEAHKWLDDVGRHNPSGTFEVRVHPDSKVNWDNMCVGCNVPLPHVDDNECVCCKALRDIDALL